MNKTINLEDWKYFNFMKQILTLLIFFISASLCGQDEASILNAKFAVELNEEGNELLVRENAKIFGKVKALGKFRKSQQLISSTNNENEALQENNKMQIQKLVDFFSSISNRDSLLNLTRFYPDSIFQENKQYSQQFKLLVVDLINNKNRKVRNDFFEIDGLNQTGTSSITSLGNFILDFDNYWPLEIIELDKALQVEENGLINFSKSSAEELLYAKFRNDRDNLVYLNKTDSLGHIIEHIRQQKDGQELELQKSKEEYKKFQNIAYGIIGLLLVVGFIVIRKNRQLLKSMNQTILEEKKRSEDLLLNILPAEVAKELKTQSSVRAHKYDTVSVLFSDFQNFSQIAKKLEPEELVAELDYCFTAFDRIIEKHRLQKIKTIGDAYMCVGGLYTKGNSHVKRMILAALEIQQFLDHLKKRREARGKHFYEARIGIHTGPIVAGVVGTKNFAFDIWGDTVNVAQQMESHSAVGKVNISGETYELVKDQFKCIHRGKMAVKNKMEFDMYYVDEIIRTPNNF